MPVGELITVVNKSGKVVKSVSAPCRDLDMPVP
jgi:hypothetical protein